jgi:hypothetical protein
MFWAEIIFRKNDFSENIFRRKLFYVEINRTLYLYIGEERDYILWFVEILFYFQSFALMPCSTYLMQDFCWIKSLASTKVLGLSKKDFSCVQGVD